MNDIFRSFREAVGPWLARASTGQDAFAMLDAFGLADAMRGASPADQAAMAAAVGIEAGRALFTGPLVEAVALEVCGCPAGSRTLAAIDPLALASPVLEGATIPVPYADHALALLMHNGAELGIVPAASLGELRLIGQADGSMLALVPHARASTATTVAHGADAAWATQQLADLLVLSTSARLIGVATRAAEATRAHLATREQFGKPLSSFQALQHGAVDTHIDIVLAEALLARLVQDWDQIDRRRSLLFALKSHASAAGVGACRQGVQMFGAMGFADEGPVGACLKHALVLASRYGGERRARTAYRQAPIDLFA